MRLFGRGRQSRESNHRTVVLPYQTDHLNKLVLQLKSPWRDGTTHSSMSPLAFMQRLTGLVPRSRLHLIRYHGVLNANAGLRAATVPGPVHNAGVLDIDLEHDLHCGGEFKTIAAIEEPVVIVRILTHLGLSARASRCSPCGRCLSSKQPDTQGDTGSATAPMIPRGLRLRMAVRVRPDRHRRGDAATNKPDREGNFHKTSRKLIADRFSVWW